MMRGWIINTDDLTEKLIYKLRDAGINELGIHPGGGKAAPELMRETLKKWNTPEYRRLVTLAEGLGITVEFDAHVLGYLLPASEFEKHPDWFRLDENGNRVPDHNMCVSNAEALGFISEKARAAAKAVRTNTHRYPFWPDDVTKSFCNCEKCRKLSPSDQALIISNAFLNGIRKEDPEAIVPYLAYYETLAVPETVKPEEGIYLEFAPIGRDSDKPIYDESNTGEAGSLSGLLEFFGKQNSRVLEYWVDNSRFSNWTRPPKYMKLNADVMRRDVEYYKSMGFADMTSFACFLGEDYIELYGEPPVEEYAVILKTADSESLRERAERLLGKLLSYPEGTVFTTAALAEDISDPDRLMALEDELGNAADARGYMLDKSAHTMTFTGLPYNIGFVLRKIER